ncbi:hypothetical protein JTB14_004676 [Gonioctena quinquepunctata]|nr:hypothetical protein JTB14_004676 [Gonioctena quinquepunctata]
MKEALEQLTRTNADLMAKAMAEEQSKFMAAQKRPRESAEFLEKPMHLEDEFRQQPAKRMKESVDKSRTPTPVAMMTPVATTPTPTPVPNGAPCHQRAGGS